MAPLRGRGPIRNWAIHSRISGGQGIPMGMTFTASTSLAGRVTSIGRGCAVQGSALPSSNRPRVRITPTRRSSAIGVRRGRRGFRAALITITISAGPARNRRAGISRTSRAKWARCRRLSTLNGPPRKPASAAPRHMRSSARLRCSWISSAAITVSARSSIPPLISIAKTSLATCAPNSGCVPSRIIQARPIPVSDGRSGNIPAPGSFRGLRAMSISTPLPAVQVIGTDGCRHD